jgi:mono/diheme cytochrome c family protein
MKLIKVAFVLLTAAFFAAACAETNTTETNRLLNNTIATAGANTQPTAAAAVDEIAVSRAIYLESCVGCHKENGEGGAAEFEGKKIKVPAFQSKGAMNASDDNLYRHIAEGEEDEMPAFKDKLNESQMRNLVTFVRKEFQKK